MRAPDRAVGTRRPPHRAVLHPYSIKLTPRERECLTWSAVGKTGGDVATIAPRDSVNVAVNVYGFTDPTLAPKLDPRLQPGVYRLLFSLGVVGDNGITASLPMEQGASTTFVVRATGKPSG